MTVCMFCFCALCWHSGCVLVSDVYSVVVNGWVQFVYAMHMWELCDISNHHAYSCGCGGGVICEWHIVFVPQWNTWFQHKVEASSKCGKHNGQIEASPGKRDAACETADWTMALRDLTFWVLHSGDQVILWAFNNSLIVFDEICNFWFLDVRSCLLQSVVLQVRFFKFLVRVHSP